MKHTQNKLNKFESKNIFKHILLIISIITCSFNLVLNIYSVALVDYEFIATPPFNPSKALNQKITSGYGLEGEGVSVKTPLIIQTEQKGNYGSYDLSTGGAGPATAAMVISALNHNISASEVAQEFANTAVPGVGFSPLIFTAMANKYSLNFSESTNIEDVRTHISSGGLVIAELKSYSGHTIVIKGVTFNGDFYVNDPASKKNSNRLWSFDEVKSKCNKFYLFSKQN